MPNPARDESVPADEAPNPSIVRAECRLRLLKELAEIGMELARALKPGAEPSGDAAQGKGRDPADAFAPLSRAIRLTLALEAKTDQELRDLKAGIVVAREVERTRTVERQRVADIEEARALARKIPDRVIEAAEAEGELKDADALVAFVDAIYERLMRDEAYAYCVGWPLRETVERLCHDLCITPDWSRWDGEEWAPGYVPDRPPYSPFNRPSRTCLLDDEGKPLQASPPGQSFHHLE